MNMSHFHQVVGSSLLLALSTSSWAQATTATGSFLGKPVNPVMAVELDAAPVRSMPGGTAAQPPNTITRPDTVLTRPASPATYTGVESSQGQGVTMPTVESDRKRTGGNP